MANQKTLTNWILAHRAELDIRVKECSWIHAAFPGWHDLDVTISVSGQRFTGRGSDKNADTALAKAFCESVERSVCHSHGISSLGVAGHYLAEEAMKNAQLEYIERKTLFEHISRGMQLNSTPIENLSLERYSRRGVNVQLFKLRSTEASVALCIASGLESENPFGGILGLGASSDDFEAAKQKALIECLRNVEAFLDSPSKSLSYEEFKSIPMPKGRERQGLFRDRAYFKNWIDSLNSREQLPSFSCSCVGNFQKLEMQDALFSNCPLQFFQFVPAIPEAIELEFVG